MLDMLRDLILHKAKTPATLAPVIDVFRATHEAEGEWMSHAGESDLARRIESPLIPGGRCSVAQAYIQVCMHSQGHRSQCATRLRALGGEPPTTDFILWLTDKPSPQWS